MKKPIYLLLVILFIRLHGDCQQFRVSYANSIFNGPFTGRVLLYLNKENKNPKDAMADLQDFPVFSVAVHDIKPGADVIFDDRADAYPVKLSDLERGDYYIQAVWDRNSGGRAIAESPGNLYSRPVKISVTKDYNKSFVLVCDQVIPPTVFKDTKFVNELKVSSALLTQFLGRATTVDAAVLLPKDYYDQPGRKYPVLFLVSGYGGDYHRYSGDSTRMSRGIDTVACITVYLDGNCAGGHSVYANSDNNGPWGDALTKEFIPQLESKYRCNGARFLQGHSSGGWTVLWLQTHYPTIFTGCWSSSPDPVDFRNFQQVNLYEGDNLYYNKNGDLRPVATIAGYFPVATMKQATRQEYVIYRGEQMHSFNFVFSAKGADGQPVPICDPVTGAIDMQCFEHWKQYDISAYLRNNWASLQKDLQGKIRVTVGNQDNFLLNFAVHLLDGEMQKLETHFVFAYYPGDHFTIGTPEYQLAGSQFLEGRYAQWKLQQ